MNGLGIFVSQEKLAEHFGVSRRTIQSLLASIVTAEVLTVEHRYVLPSGAGLRLRRTTNAYHLNPALLQEDCGQVCAQDCAQVGGQLCAAEVPSVQSEATQIEPQGGIELSLVRQTSEQTKGLFLDGSTGSDYGLRVTEAVHKGEARDVVQLARLTPSLADGLALDSDGCRGCGSPLAPADSPCCTLEYQRRKHEARGGSRGLDEALDLTEDIYEEVPT